MQTAEIINLHSRPVLSGEALAKVRATSSAATRLRPMLTSSLTHADAEQLPNILKDIAREALAALKAIEAQP